MPKLGTEVRAIWIVSNPRTGSMWTTNVVREIVRREGEFLATEARLGDPPTIIDIGTRHVMENHPGIAVMKSHAAVPVLPGSAGIVTRRDARDALMSYMRFMRVSFDAALAYTRRALGRLPEAMYAGEHRLLVDYDDIIGRPERTVAAIAAFLEAEKGVAASREIASMFSKSAVQERIDAADRYVRERFAVGETVEAKRMVMLAPDNWRAYDPQTGFQSGHVSDYEPGDWRTLLTPEQQDRLEAVIEQAGRTTI